MTTVALSESNAPASVGVVTPETLVIHDPLTLTCGAVLPSYQLVYETYGRLNDQASNAVLICHALSGDHHAAGYHHEDDKTPGWWDHYIGPGKAIDTNVFFVVGVNNIGSCRGSTGPASINPATQQPYGPDFPMVTCADWVVTQAKLADHLGIDQWAAVVGGSLGGMQVQQWAIDFPSRLKHAVIIASAPRLSAQNIAFNEVARQAIMTDPEFHGGHFLANNTIPKQGLMLARMLGHLTYLSDDLMGQKFGRELRSGHLKYSYDVEFQVESYLRYQGEKFATKSNFDANSYLLMTKALDYFDPALEHNDDLVAAYAPIEAQALVVAFTTDWRFSPERSLEMVKALRQAGKRVVYAEVESTHGHDAFLLPNTYYEQVFATYMKRVAVECAL